MINKKFKLLIISLSLLTISCDQVSQNTTVIGNTPKEFTSSSSVTTIQEQLRKLPKNDMWWTRNGEDMAWNNKNLHQIFPTVNVYRNGSVSPLKIDLMTKINNTEIDTPYGRITF